MRVTENTGRTVTIEATSREAACLAGRNGFGDRKRLQKKLETQIRDSWYDAGCPEWREPEGVRS